MLAFFYGSAFQEDLDYKQQRDEKQKADQYLVTAFVKKAMGQNIFPIGKNHDDYKSDEKNGCECQLSGSKHVQNYFGKCNPICPEVIILQPSFNE